MEDWSQFFRTVLPHDTDGVYVLARGRENPTAQHFVTFNDLVATVNSRQNSGDSGDNEYYALAQYRPGTVERNKGNVQALRAIVFDVDVRDEENAYRTKDEALEALIRLIQNGVVPFPTYIIDTGRGYHVYWATNRDMTGGEYINRSSALAQRIKNFDGKLAKDTSINRNSATLLRLPASFNQRTAPLMRVGHLTLPDGSRAAPGAVIYDPDDLGPDTALLPSALPAAMPMVVAGQLAGRGEARVIRDPIIPLKSSQDIYDGCAVMRWMKDNRSDTSINYDAWRDMVVLLACCEDADTAVHEWSEGHPGYTPQDAATKLAHARSDIAKGGPITCGQLCSNLPFGRSKCAGCPVFKADGGNTPYRAGVHVVNKRVQAQAAEAVAKPACLPQLDPLAVIQQAASPLGSQPTGSQINPQINPNLPAQPQLPAVALMDEPWVSSLKHAAQQATETEMQPIDLIGLQLDPRLMNGEEPGFTVNTEAGTLWWQPPFAAEDAASADPPVLVSRALVWPIRYVQVPGSDRANLQVAIARREDGQWIGRYAVLDYKSYGARIETFITELGGLKASITGPTAAQRAYHSMFRRRVSELSDKNMMRHHDSFGWQTDNSFVVGDYVSKDGGIGLASLSDSLRVVRNKVFDLKGDTNTALNSIRWAWAYGSDVLKAILMLGVGTPFLRDLNVIGLYVNLFGRGGYGKSLVASLMNSVWGSGSKNKPHLASLDTINFRYSVLGQMSTLPLWHDEATMLHQQFNDNDLMGNYLYEVTGGKDKGRADKTGESREQRTWATTVVATSNNALFQVATKMSDTVDAQLARAFEIPVDRYVIDGPGFSPNRELEMTALGQSMDSCSGVLGVLLAQFFTANRERLQASARAIAHDVMKHMPGSGPDMRARHGFVSGVMMGGLILREAGIIPCTEQECAVIAIGVHNMAQVAKGAEARDPRQAVADAVLAMQANTAMVIHDPSASAQPRTIHGGQARAIAPRGDVKQRFEYTLNDSYATIYVTEAALRAQFRAQGADFTYIQTQLTSMGISIARTMVDMYSGIPLMARDAGSNVPLNTPPVKVLKLEFDVVPTTMTSSGGGIPPFPTFIGMRSTKSETKAQENRTR